VSQRVNVILIAACFVAVFLGVGSFTLNLRARERLENLQAVQSGFRTVTELIANGIANGNFQWDDMRQAVSANDEAAIGAMLGQITATFRFTSSADIKTQAPPDTYYQIVVQDSGLKVRFKITDSAGKRELPAKTGLVSLDAGAILDSIQQKRLFILAWDGEPFLYGLKIRYIGPLVQAEDVVIALSLGALTLILPSVFIRRNNRFFYEVKGLDTIIFLFENTEKYSAHHSRRVAELASDVGRRLGLSKKRLKDLRTAALLHDIGKIAVPRDILTKPDALTPAEFSEIKTHPEASGRILEYFAELAHLVPFVRGHHEKMDGSGYPDGLTGPEMALETRIIAVVDIFEALTGERPYRKPFTPQRAFEVLKTMSVDQQIVAVLESLVAPAGGPVGTGGPELPGPAVKPA
jgi:HD-GYP domain-containing protein (c-di-GMP phosphodiesterase class II)